ncbi:MAG: ArsR/SmtB family transcription factor, partial [Thermodesulfobacteriota bacterium]
DGIRLEILECLFSGELSVSEISNKIGKKHSQVSHHLSILRNLGLVVDNREGKFVIYKIHPELFKKIMKGKYRNVIDLNCCSVEFPNRTSSRKVRKIL